MRPAPPVPAHPRRRDLALRVGLAAALVAGVAAALPSLAAEGYSDATGYLELPAPTLSAADLAFDFATCPEPPPNQGVDAWVYDLAGEVVAGSSVSVTGSDGAGTTDLTAYVYDTDCTYDRVVSSDAALDVVMEANDRFLAVTTATGTGTSLLLEVGPAVVTSPSPTSSLDPVDPDPTGPQVMVRREYPSPVSDPYYRESSTGPVGGIAAGGQWGMRIVQAEQAWQQRVTGAGITVAVLDSGLDLGHPEFGCDPHKVAELESHVPGYLRFKDVADPDGHGTHVAGIIGACTNNDEGVVGVAPDATLLPIQALSPEEATAERLASAINTAVASGAHVINMSLGFSALGLPATGSAIALVGGFPQIDRAIADAVAAGVVVVAAAGNESVPICGYPALAEKVVCVGSSDRRDLNAWYGNFPVTPGGVALLAPGGSGQVFCDVQSENVLSTYSTQVENGCAEPAEGYRGLDGTSMAAPHVAGVAALVYDRLGGERNPGNGAAVVQALVDGAKDLYTPGYDPMSGDGRVDAVGALAAAGTANPSPTGSPSASGSPEDATSLTLIARDTGQTTDELPVAARVEGADGQPVTGAEVSFVLDGSGGTKSGSATTGQDGVAATDLLLDLEPGAYTLTASYPGQPGSRRSASDSQPVQVVRDDSVTTLVVDGRGATRTLAVTLTDQDSSAGLAGQEVVLLADGRQVGTVTTDESGRATFAPQGRDRAAQSYEARFAGNGDYEPSAARASG